MKTPWIDPQAAKNADNRYGRENVDHLSLMGHGWYRVDLKDGSVAAINVNERATSGAEQWM